MRKKRSQRRPQRRPTRQRNRRSINRPTGQPDSHRPPDQPHASKGARRAARPAIRIRPVDGQNGFELVYPACVRERREDMEEVYKMLELGEIEAAEDELRWLLQGCHALLDAHRLLGHLALESARWDLARAHLGYAYELVCSALGERFEGTLPYARPANRPFHEAGHDLVQCLLLCGERSLAKEVADQLRRWDPTDPLRTAELLKMLPVAVIGGAGDGLAAENSTAAAPESCNPVQPSSVSRQGAESSREGLPDEGGKRSPEKS